MKELAKKLVLAVKAIDAVEKRGKNEKQGYAYVKATDVASTVRTVLAEQGIAFSYDCIETERWEKQTNAGGTLFFVQLKIAVTFTEQESGESMTVGGMGWGMDSGDKAIYKAMTGALKYALRMNFLIPDELDPENDSHDRHEVTRVSQQHSQSSDEPPLSAYDEAPQTIPSPKRVNGSGKPAPGKNDVTGKDAISEKQAKRFVAIAIGQGKSKEDMDFALAQAGLSQIEHCPWKKDKSGVSLYDNLCAWAGQ